MSRRGQAGVTVGSVVRKLGVSRECEVSWAVGRAAAALWRERNGGQRPPVALVKKSGGGGTHHMAVYPASFRPTLVRLARLAAAAIAAQARPVRKVTRRSRQPDLFGALR